MGNTEGCAASATGRERLKLVRSLFLPALLWPAFCLCQYARGQDGRNLPDAPSVTLARNMVQDASFPPAQSSARSPAQRPPIPTGSITGSVIDGEANVVRNADIALIRDNQGAILNTTTNDQGTFRLDNVPAGKVHITASISGLSPGSFYGTLKPGETLQTPPIRLQIGAVDSTVDVIASPVELAEAEIHVEEHQRVLGVVPNFYTVYDWNAPPLTTRQKYELAWKNVTDPGSFFITGFTAGIEQADDGFSGYGQGMAGYGRRYGAASGDLISGTYLGGAILPSLFHQDPRYFYKGTGTIKQRTLYAISRAFLCRGDNGRNQVNYSGILGDLAAGALANTYYPATDRQGAALTFEEGGLNILGDAAGNIVQEFALKHLTPHAPNYASTSKSAATEATGTSQP